MFAEHTMFHFVNGSYGPKRVGLTRMRLMSQKALRLHFWCLGCSPNLGSWEKLVAVYISSPLPQRRQPPSKRQSNVAEPFNAKKNGEKYEALSNRSRTSKTSKRNSATAPTAGTPKMVANHGVGSNVLPN